MTNLPSLIGQAVNEQRSPSSEESSTPIKLTAPKNMKSVVCLIVLFAAVASARFTSCGANELVQVMGVESYAMNGTVTVKVEAGTRVHLSTAAFRLAVSFMGVELSSEEGDLCSLTACPINEGKFVMTKSFAAPSGIGAYTVSLSATNDAASLFCAEFPVNSEPQLHPNGDCTVSIALKCAASIDTCWDQCSQGFSPCVQCLGPMWDQCCPCLKDLFSITC